MNKIYKRITDLLLHELTKRATNQDVTDFINSGEFPHSKHGFSLQQQNSVLRAQQSGKAKKAAAERNPTAKAVRDEVASAPVIRRRKTREP